MQINEFHTFNIKDAVKFHNELNPKLFNPDKKMDSEVRDQLLVIAKDFITELGIKDLDVEDITISGSNAAYSYTDHSDIDLHILVDFSKLPDDEVYNELFLAKKTVYNDEHDITVRGIPVELYVQDVNKPHVSLGEYSVLHDKWLRIPVKDKENFNSTSTKAKYEKLYNLIMLAIKSKDYDKVNKTLDILKRYRRAGLDNAGEFGPENLAYKALRNQGIIQQLFDVRNKLHSKELSIEETKNKINFDPVVKDILEILPDSKEIWFHGSRAIGKHKRNSDIDVLVIVPDKTTPDEYLDINRNLHRLSNKHNNFDIQPSHENYNIHRIAKEEGKLLYSAVEKVDPTYNVNEASGYIPSEKEKNDPRFKTALTVDVKPDSIKKNAKAFGFNISRSGIPPQAQPSGKYKRINK